MTVRLTLGISRSGAYHYTRRCRLHAGLGVMVGQFKNRTTWVPIEECSLKRARYLRAIEARSHFDCLRWFQCIRNDHEPVFRNHVSIPRKSVGLLVDPSLEPVNSK
jgi:hypothetical protein